MPTYLDLASWTRREHFEFFRRYDNPFFNLCSRLDATRLSTLESLPGGPSFFLSMHFLALRAANEIESFRYRLRGDRVLVHERVHAGTIVLLEDERFAFCYFDYVEDYRRFAQGAREAIAAVRSGPGRLEPRDDRDDLIHFTTLPWVDFTSLSHARNWRTEDSVPKIAFGRRREEGGGQVISISVEVHHALMDGLHVGRFLGRLQELVDDAEAALGLGPSAPNGPDDERDGCRE